MSLSYDVFMGAFLAKVSEFNFSEMDFDYTQETIDGYLKRAAVAFRKNCEYDLTDFDDENRVFNIDVTSADADELADIISEGMLIEWLKPFVYRQENLELHLNTKDFTSYSPSELLLRIGGAYAKAQSDYTKKIRDYSFDHGDLSRLHL